MRTDTDKIAGWFTPEISAKIFAGLMGFVCAFQIALALGTPWARLAMGGAYPLAYPPVMRMVALLIVVLLAASALIILSRAGLAWRSGRRHSRRWAWLITGVLLVGLILNLLSPSQGERLLWAPVTFGLVLTAARVAWSR